ncbi:vanadium-dependent haloperoxidase [Arenibacter sp. F26102]|uniref:vanadium-dependent haloperoxidase n=1 Tax=Arenibacter sp. F26102 TaxID=2926416 RepID=UPI001FF6B888|nr:vanadium-dependent haloperoxidase [Arenibacter sp. F26102]MCK0144552.1 vanadium-dependent haloperoxidase [Arenibacter sp. F26102]
MKYIPILLLIITVSLSCSSKHDEEKLDAYFEGSLPKYNRKLTDVIVSDIFTPPVASRIYAYSNIAAYEGIRFVDSTKISLTEQLNGGEKLTLPDTNKSYYYPLVSTVAFFKVGEKLVFNLEKVGQIEKKILQDIRTIGIDKEVYDNSIAYGEKLAQEILHWASKDGYLKRTALPRYSVSEDPGLWRPTPPDYMDAIEPHWSTLRPFVLDSAKQFDPGSPTTFDTDENSKFYEEAKEVYKTVQSLDSTQFQIAKFWDCNPNISHTNGHVMYFQQQISPGGHWVHIAAQILEEKKASQLKAATTLAKLSIAIADAFISCWDQKYTSNLIRPQTYINKYIDQNWNPILQTPAFPEHTSGHSVASASAASVLTHIFGDNYSFVDATEVPYGLPPRSFKSFNAAAQEAAISRLYGGIHYRPAIDLGVMQGKAVGTYVINNLRFE